MQKVQWKVTIETLSPLNIGSGTQSKTEKMGYTVRKMQKGQGEKEATHKSFIPGSTIKGKLKYNFSMLDMDNHKENEHCDCRVCKLFGSVGYSPSRIYIDDFNLVNNEVAEVRSCNRLDRKRRVCVEGALFTKETVCGRYEGEITAFVEEKQIIEDITTAILMIKELGSAKSRGLGQVKVSIKQEGEVQ